MLARTRGIVVALVSIVCSSPDATLLRSLQQTGKHNSIIIAWKACGTALIQLAFGVYQEESPGTMLRKAREAWPWMICGAISLSFAWLATVANMTSTSASALALFYIAPLWAMPMGMLVNRDPLRMRTLVAMAVAFVGICFIFAPNLLSAASAPAHSTRINPGHKHQHQNTNTLSGDVCGLISGIAFAVWITTCRHASLRKPETPLALCGALGTVLVMIPAIVMAVWRGERLFDVSARFVVLVLLDCASVAAYNIGTMIASRYLQSAELGLYLTLDVVFAPLLVWLVHAELPTSAVLLGGMLLVLALIAHEAIVLVVPDAPAAMVHSIDSMGGKLKFSDVNLAALTDENATLLKSHDNDDG